MDKLIAILSAIKESYRISLEISLDVGGMGKGHYYKNHNVKNQKEH
jgi:hypothetical protein